MDSNFVSNGMKDDSDVNLSFIFGVKYLKLHFKDYQINQAFTLLVNPVLIQLHSVEHHQSVVSSQKIK